MPRYVAVIVGIAGGERFLLDAAHETTELRRAARYPSAKQAESAAKGRISLEDPVVRKHMGFRVEPIRRVSV